VSETNPLYEMEAALVNQKPALKIKRVKILAVKNKSE
jgi:hypothetical protein